MLNKNAKNNKSLPSSIDEILDHMTEEEQFEEKKKKKMTKKRLFILLGILLWACILLAYTYISDQGNKIKRTNVSQLVPPTSKVFAFLRNDFNKDGYDDFVVAYEYKEKRVVGVHMSNKIGDLQNIANHENVLLKKENFNVPFEPLSSIYLNSDNIVINYVYGDTWSTNMSFTFRYQNNDFYMSKIAVNLNNIGTRETENIELEEKTDFPQTKMGEFRLEDSLLWYQEKRLNYFKGR